MIAAVPPVVVRRTIAASREELFDAWLDPALVAVWLRPGSFENSDVQIDARVGGEFRIDMKRAGVTVSHRGKYTFIDRPNILAFTWISANTGGMETLVTVDFKACEQGTEVVVVHGRLPDEGAAASHSEGWTHVIGRLAGSEVAPFDPPIAAGR